MRVRSFRKPSVACLAILCLEFSLYQPIFAAAEPLSVTAYALVGLARSAGPPGTVTSEGVNTPGAAGEARPAPSVGPRAGSAHVVRRVSPTSAATPRVTLAAVVRQYNRHLDGAAELLRWRSGPGLPGQDAGQIELLLGSKERELAAAGALLEERLHEVRETLLVSGRSGKLAELDAFLPTFRDRHLRVRGHLRTLAGPSGPRERGLSEQQLMRILDERERGRRGPSLGQELAVQPLHPAQPIVFETGPPSRESTVTPAYLGGEEGVLAGDLDPTPEVQITPEIVALAAELGHSPLRIYQFVRDETSFEAYFGSLKGSQAALETLAGNDYDLASLLIALLRESGIPARYVRGTVALDAERARNWLGLRHPDAVNRHLNTAGIDAAPFDEGGDGTLDWFEIDRVWVEARIPHANYRGVTGSGGGEVWVPLDPAFKLHHYQAGIAGVPASVPFDENGYLAQRTPLLAFEWYQRQVRDWLAVNLPGRGLDDIPYAGRIVPEGLGLLPASLPQDVVAFTGEWSELPENLRHRFRITLFDDLGATLIDRTLRAVESSLSRITISYAESGALAGLDETPAFLVDLIPELKIDGVVDSSGPTVSPGEPIDIRVRFYFPDDDPVEELTHQNRSAGDYHALSLDLFQVSETSLDRSAQALIEANALVGTPGEDRDDLQGELLHLVGMRYWQRVQQGDDAVADIFQFRTVKQLYEVLASSNDTVEYLYDRPFALTPGNLNVDSKRQAKGRVGIDGDQSREANLSMIEGRSGSAQEHAVWEEIVTIDSVSTIKALQYANETDIDGDGTPNHGDVLDITDLSGLNDLCPGFPSGARSSMQTALGQGMVVKTPYCDFVMNDWHGVGWIEEDPSGGAGAYLISGYLAGGATTEPHESRASGWTPLGRGGFRLLETCARQAGVRVLTLTEPRDVALLDVPSAVRRALRDELQAGRRVRAPAAPVTCGGVERFAYLVEETGEAYEALNLLGGSGTEDPPPEVPNEEQNGPPDEEQECESTGEPVTLSNGNMYHRFLDLEVLGIGPSLRFERIYNSQSDRLGPMGYGWSHSYDVFLTEDPGVSATLTDGGGRGTTFTDLGGGAYDSPAGVHEELEATGSGWTLTYVDGEVWSFDTAGRLVSREDTYGNAVTLTYDGSDRLSTVTDALSRSLTLTYGPDDLIDTLSDWAGRTWTFVHDGGGDLTSSSTPTDVDTPSYTTLYSYYSVSYLAHNLASIQFPESYTIDFEYYSNDKLFRHDESGRRTTTYVYQPLRRMTAVTDARGGETRYFYDQKGSIVRIEWPDGSAQSMTRDAELNRIEQVNEAGYLESFTWDSRGRLLTHTNALSDTESFTYDTGFPHPSTHTDFNGETTTYDVDPLTGRVTRIEDAETGETHMSYDSLGRLHVLTDPRGKTHTYSYDPVSGRVSRIDHPLGLSEEYTWDTLGRTLSETDSESNVKGYRYDALGRVLEVTDPESESDFYEYNGLNRPTRRVNREGRETTYHYDDLGQLVSSIDPLGRETLTSWTDPGCGCSTEGLATEIITPGERVWSYEYDERGRVVRATDPSGAASLYGWDPRGLLDEEVRPDGLRIDYSYDALGRLVEIDPEGDGTLSFGYDDEGRVSSASNGTTSQTMLYDGVGRLTRFEDSLTGKVVQYDYDDAGLLTELRDGENLPTTYVYDDAGRLSSIQDFDTQGYTVTPDGLGRAAQIAFPNGQTMTRLFDGNGNVLSLVVSGTGGTAVDRSYTYDARARALSELDAVHGSSSYGYDPVGRLIEALRTGRPDESYGYDEAGNRIQEASGLALLYDGADRLVRRGGEDYLYDARGNLVERRGLQGATSYAYDWRDRMVSADLPDGTSLGFRYDPFGYRIEKSVDGEVTRLLRDRTEVLARYNGAGTLQAKYLRTGVEAEAIAVRRGGSKYYLHQDPRRSTVAVSNAAGVPVARMLYDAWGRIVDTEGPWDDPVLFIGRDLDPELGLYDLQARHYQPATGRFLQIDPLGFEGGLPNLYPYAANDPVNRFDPTGEGAIIVIGGLVIAIATVCAAIKKSHDNTNQFHENIRPLYLQRMKEAKTPTERIRISIEYEQMRKLYAKRTNELNAEAGYKAVKALIKTGQASVQLPHDLLGN